MSNLTRVCLHELSLKELANFKIRFLWPCPLWQKAVGRGEWWWWAMMGMEEKPGGRPLMLGGWPGKGVSAGDKGKLLYTQHIRDAGRDNGEETQALSFKTKETHTKKQTAEAYVAISLFKKSFCSSSCCFNVPFHPHYSLLNVPLLANARNYFLLIFKLHWCWLHLRSLFTSTFNLPGGWVWLQGTILTSLSDNQTKLALKLLSCDCLKFLDTHWIWQVLLQRNYNVI